MLGASGGNGLCGAADTTSLKNSPSDSTCGSSTKESQSLLSSYEIGVPKGGGSPLVLSGMISWSGTGTDLFLSWMRSSWYCRCLPSCYFFSRRPGSSSQTSAKGGGLYSNWPLGSYSYSAYQSRLESKRSLQVWSIIGLFLPLRNVVSNKSSKTIWYCGEVYPVLRFRTVATKVECSSEKPRNCPWRDRRFHLGSFWSFCNFTSRKNIGHPQTWERLNSRWLYLVLVSISIG